MSASVSEGVNGCGVRPVRGLSLIPHVAVLWPATIASVSLGPVVLLAVVIPALLLALVREKRLRAHALLAVLLGAAIAGPVARVHSEHMSLDEALRERDVVSEAVVALREPPSQPVQDAAWDTATARATAKPTASTIKVGMGEKELPGDVRIVLTWSGSTRGESPMRLAQGEVLSVRGHAEKNGSTLFVEITEWERSEVTNHEGEGISAHVGRFLDGWREERKELVRGTSSFLPPNEAALVLGMTLGDVTGLEKDTKDAMATSGLTHLVAASGANIALTYAFVTLPLLAFGVRRKHRVVAGAAGIAIYVAVVGPEPSLLRAALMAVPLMVGRYFGFRTPPVNALALTVLGWCLLDPALVGEVGFVLSVGATWAILALSVPLANILQQVSGGRITRNLALVLAVPTVAQAACTPVLLLLAPETSVWAVPANIAAELVVAPATVSGFVGIILAHVWAPLGVPFFALAGAGAHVLVLIAQVSAALPGAHIALPAGAGGALATAGVLIIVGLTLWLRTRREVRWALVFLAVIALFGGVSTLIPGDVEDWDVVMCDVGQGDAMLVRTGGHTVLIDTGPEPAKLARCLERARVESVDLLVVTHPHADHDGGIPALEGQWAPKRAWVCPLDASTGAKLPHTKVETVLAPRTETVGSLSLEVLWPRSAEEARALGAGEGGGEESALNDCSISMLVKTPTWSALTLGDLEPHAQAVLAKSGAVEAVELVKVAHHGSRRQEPALYDAAHASIAVIGVGANTFGHPHQRTLSLLAERGMAVRRTDDDGMVVMKRAGDGWLVRTLR